MTFEEWMKKQDPEIIRDAFSAAAGWSAGQLAERESSESKYKDAIQNCINMANGRESEWGQRAESAFAFLYNAIYGEEE